MDAKQAEALRKEFAPAQVGKLPKPYKADSQRGNCSECHGYHGLPAVHLDYVGHAAVTDRLLQVDPNWSWEPFSVDDKGLPALDGKNNLWIRLTVAGVTRIGVGDGKSAKECIGDAIRNAAMRFGVALDLWAKEDLHDTTGENDAPPGTAAEQPRAPQPTRTMSRGARKAAAAPPVSPPPAEPPPPADPIHEPPGVTRPQMAKMAISFDELGYADRADRLRACAAMIGHPLASSQEMTRAEASSVIETLALCQAAPDPQGRLIELLESLAQAEGGAE